MKSIAMPIIFLSLSYRILQVQANIEFFKLAKIFELHRFETYDICSTRICLHVCQEHFKFMKYDQEKINLLVGDGKHANYDNKNHHIMATAVYKTCSKMMFILPVRGCLQLSVHPQRQDNMICTFLDSLPFIIEL